MYQMVDNGVIRLSDGAVLPLHDPDYIDWILQGNAPRPSPPTGHHKWDDVAREWYIDTEVQQLLDIDAANSGESREREFDDILPSWPIVNAVFDNIEVDIDAITSLANAKTVLKRINTNQRRMARILYWLATNKGL